MTPSQQSSRDETDEPDEGVGNERGKPAGNHGSRPGRLLAALQRAKLMGLLTSDVDLPAAAMLHCCKGGLSQEAAA